VNSNCSEAKNETGDRHSRFRFYGDRFVLDTVSGSFFRVSPTAGFILRMLVDGKDQAGLVDIVERRFGIDHSRANRDVEFFLVELRSLGIDENLGH
jgi:hypothetical protein